LLLVEVVVDHQLLDLVVLEMVVVVLVDLEQEPEFQ
jgi:hypothetical protein